MVLSAADLPHYLMERGLVSASSFVDGDFKVHELSRRNRVFRVSRGPFPGYVVKQVMKWTPEILESMEREAGVYSAIRSDPRLSFLREMVPQCYVYDADNLVFVLELLDSARREDHAASVGQSLRRLRQESSALRTTISGFRMHDPWILSLHRKSERNFDRVSAANAELMRVVKRETAVGEALDELRASWQSDTLVHGDMKWDNCLVAENGTPKFIDWEMCGWGDPLWDAAGILQEYLSVWVQGHRPAPSRRTPPLDSPAAEVAPRMRDFWESYKEPAESLPRAVKLAAARLVQTAWESQQRSESMTAKSVRLLQASVNMLASPEAAVEMFFGAEA